MEKLLESDAFWIVWMSIVIILVIVTNLKFNWSSLWWSFYYKFRHGKKKTTSKPFDFGRDFFLKKVTNELRENNLGIMADLLEDADRDGYENYSAKRKKMECEMLKKNFDVQKEPANESLNRFALAKDICEKHDFIKGASFMQNYIDIYKKYIRDYCD